MVNFSQQGREVPAQTVQTFQTNPSPVFPPWVQPASIPLAYSQQVLQGSIMQQPLALQVNPLQISQGLGGQPTPIFQGSFQPVIQGFPGQLLAPQVNSSQVSQGFNMQSAPASQITFQPVIQGFPGQLLTTQVNSSQVGQGFNMHSAPASQITFQPVIQGFPGQLLTTQVNSSQVGQGFNMHSAPASQITFQPVIQGFPGQLQTPPVYSGQEIQEFLKQSELDFRRSFPQLFQGPAVQTAPPSLLDSLLAYQDLIRYLAQISQMNTQSAVQGSVGQPMPFQESFPPAPRVLIGPPANSQLAIQGPGTQFTPAFQVGFQPTNQGLLEQSTSVSQQNSPLTFQKVVEEFAPIPQGSSQPDIQEIVAQSVLVSTENSQQATKGIDTQPALPLSETQVRKPLSPSPQPDTERFVGQPTPVFSKKSQEAPEGRTHPKSDESNSHKIVGDGSKPEGKELVVIDETPQKTKLSYRPYVKPRKIKVIDQTREVVYWAAVKDKCIQFSQQQPIPPNSINDSQMVNPFSVSARAVGETVKGKQFKRQQRSIRPKFTTHSQAINSFAVSAAASLFQKTPALINDASTSSSPTSVPATGSPASAVEKVVVSAPIVDLTIDDVQSLVPVNSDSEKVIEEAEMREVRAAQPAIVVAENVKSSTPDKTVLAKEISPPVRKGIKFLLNDNTENSAPSSPPHTQQNTPT